MFTVTEKAVRPNGPKDRCFYCRSKIGETHGPECVMVSKTVKVRMTIEYYITVPSFWDKEVVERHRNESSWCASNALDELEKLWEENGKCICDFTKFKYIGEESHPFLDEE